MRRLCISLALLAVACSRGSAPGTPAGPGAASTDGSSVVAVVDGTPISGGDLDHWIRDDLYRQETRGKGPAELYEYRHDALERMIDERLVEAEAKSRGLTPEQLTEQQTSKLPPVTDADVKSFFDQNAQRLGGQAFDAIAPRIRLYLQQQQKRKTWHEFVASLRERAKVETRMEPPRIEVAATGPVRGRADAPVTIVEFSDFECPFCRRAEATVRQLLERYPDQVRLVYRHFPLEMHPDALPAAEAAACAADQGKFWEFHDKLLSGPLDAASRERYASEVGLDMERYKACVAKRQFKDAVAADQKAGEAAGVSGTPAFFVNGVPLSGARPLEEFVKVIDGELLRAGVTPPKAPPAAAKAS
jgi:protein-disulfide isomerase